MLDTLFVFIHLLILLCWIPLLFVPFSKFTYTLFHSIWIWIVLGVTYVTMLIIFGSEIDWMTLAIPNINELSNLISKKEITAIAWIHLLIFDLFVGHYIVIDARKNKNFVFPFLLATLTTGPMGLFLYLIYSRYKYNKMEL